MSGTTKTDVIVLGAGAAGMQCAIEAGRRGRRVVVIDHAKAPGEKIRISGGGRCNFTNVHSGPKNFLSENPRFAISALKAFTPQDFIDRVMAAGIAFHEKTLGQLFCDGSSREIIAMLTDAMAQVEAGLLLNTSIETVAREGDGYRVRTSAGDFLGTAVVVATGGKSIPKMGATGFAYEVARQFGHRVTDTRPALVPFTWPNNMAETWSGLSGVAVDVRAQCGAGTFDEAMLLTHRGLSGPAMLQVSSYWQDGDAVDIDLLPGLDLANLLRGARADRPKTAVGTALADLLPKRLAQALANELGVAEMRLGDLSNKRIDEMTAQLKRFPFTPGGTEGYRTAEVTLGGIDTACLNQKTMESRLTPGLHFIGEAVDVTGHLGGHNFQWAWASGAAAGRHV
ncbi:MAG: NAD(P)/FAD-dependent oxidoreductase [Pseudomonadota bacterium]